MLTSGSPLIFSSGSYEALAAKIAEVGNFDLGRVERRLFNDGEHYLRILSHVAGREAVLVSGTIDDDETLELYDLANAIVDNGALRLTVMLPYFGYSTMERAVKPGEAVKAKYRARLLSSIPHAAVVNRFFMLDLHSEGIPYYFERGAQTHHVYAKEIVIRAVGKMMEQFSDGHFVLACTDAGRSKWVESLARDIGIPPAFAYKRRLGDSTVSLGVSGPMHGSFIVIYDDMIRTGSSLLEAARAYKEAGAEGLAAVSTHGLFPDDALDKLRASGLFEQIIVTDSHPRSQLLQDDFLQVESVAELFCRALSSSG